MIFPFFAQFFTFYIKLFRWLLLNVALHAVQSRFVAIFVLSEHVIEEGDVRDCELERIHFAQSLLVRQSWNVRAETFEGLVDRLHATTLTEIGGVTLLGLLRGAFDATVFWYSTEKLKEGKVSA